MFFFLIKYCLIVVEMIELSICVNVKFISLLKFLYVIFIWYKLFVNVLVEILLGWFKFVCNIFMVVVEIIL